MLETTKRRWTTFPRGEMGPKFSPLTTWGDLQIACFLLETRKGWLQSVDLKAGCRIAPGARMTPSFP